MMSFQDESRNSFQNSSLYMIVSAGYLLLAFVPVLLLDDDTIVKLTMEDSFYESVGALYWLVASVLFFVLFVKRRDSNKIFFMRTDRNIFFFLLGCLFFLGFGEEISWGQRIIGFQTPELLSKFNAQNEVNIHNLQIFHGKDAEKNPKGFIALMTNIDRLFSVFWFTYCLLVPVVYRISSKAAALITRVALPVVPIWIGVFFMLNYLISKVFEWTLRSVVEIKEHNFAFLFVILGVWFLVNYKGNLESGNSERIADA